MPISIQDLDNSYLSRTYVERLFATNQFKPAPLLNNDPTAAIDRGTAKAAIIIPPNFEREIKSRKPVTIQALVDGTDVNNARIIQASLRATTQFFVRSVDLIPASVVEPINTNVRLWFNPGRKESLYIVPGIFGVVLWVFPSMLSGIALVKEKEEGTVAQVYASDLSSIEWLLGKELAYLAVGLDEALIVMTVATLLFGLRFRGDPTTLLLGTVVYLAASVAFGLLVGARAANQTAAVQGTAIAGFLTALLLSGFIYRIENIPFPLSLISKIIPARYFIEITRDAFVRGTGWVGVWYAPLMIALVGLFFFRTAAKVLSRMQFLD
ncbi:MAG: ABC transporter permease [Leptolyngbya foveolarum]|uniref:ABC transporter permease n=1 Tax=Leptolyngbya foveolarum TaxID=47253 RepID=A0A2W4W1K0_9CYAN|nr:MAG: ABC transporter permease [Leptolyngbya foveolarum]